VKEENEKKTGGMRFSLAATAIAFFVLVTILAQGQGCEFSPG
jgi:hypothetical protein